MVGMDSNEKHDFGVNEPFFLNYKLAKTNWCVVVENPKNSSIEGWMEKGVLSTSLI